MSKTKKALILTFTMIFAIAVSAMIVSFSYAGGANNVTPSLAAADGDAASGESLDVAVDKLTNIDHIIDKANDASLPLEERVFHIVQIVSNKETETSLKKYVEETLPNGRGYFAEYVINNNRSAGHAEMPATVDDEPSVQIDVLTVDDLRNIVSAKPIDYSRINIADLIYITNDPAEPFKGGDVNSGDQGNDIPEDIHKLIQPYVAGDNKPLIIDNEGVSGGGNVFAMTNLVSNVLAQNYIKYRTFGWPVDGSMADLLQRKKGSVFIPLEITDENYKHSKVLVIYGDGNSHDMYDQINGDHEAFKKDAFYRKGLKPDDIEVTQISYNTITDATFADGYDFVFIENDTYSQMDAVKYNAISTVSFAKKHLIYSEGMVLTGSTSSGSDNESNYKEIYTMVVSEEGVAKQSNVYVSSYTFFDAMVADPAGTQEAANAIAALLKSSTYREFGANSASGKKYTVLEIQPAYPIDEDLADKNKGYYTVPNNVYKSSKETTPSGKEYYAFELSMEKIMALTGLDSSEINLVQLSAEELQGIKTSIMDKYDLVYIGGNVSALTTAADYNFNNGGRISQFIKSDDEFHYVVTNQAAGSKISAADSEDGKEHTVESLNQAWPSYTIQYALLPEDTTYQVGDMVPASETVDGKEHQVVSKGTRLGYNTEYFVYVVPQYKVGDKVPADQSVDGQEKTVTSNWKTVSVYKVITKSSQKGYAFYQMYSHTGAYVVSDSGLYGVESGDYADSGGNDITFTNLENLKSYIDSGLPIIFSDDVTKAYKEMKTYKDPYENANLDPDSNMSKLLEYALNVKGAENGSDFQISTSKNVLAGLNTDDTIRIANLSGEYGDTAVSGADYVEVFNDGFLEPCMIKDAGGAWKDYDEDKNPDAGRVADTAGGQIKALINQTVTRPTMNLKKMPSIYVANTPSSYLQTPSLNFEFELLTNGNKDIESFTVYLYIDDNSNGIFTDAGENVKPQGVTVQVGSDGKATGGISYEMSDPAFYGPISWKIEAVANLKSEKGTGTVPGPSISYNAISKVVRTTDQKDLVHILQIMPKSTSQQGNATLYFCIECQLENQIALYNGHLNSGASKDNKLNYIAAMYQNYGATATVSQLKNDTKFNSGEPYRYRSAVLKMIEDANNKTVEHYGTGLHEHHFGIWKYDSDIGYDDWNSNLADALTGEDGDFEFDIDIFCPEDLDAMEKEYSTNDVAKLQDAYEKVKAKKDATKDEIDAAKKKIEDLEEQKLTAASDLYEEYENLVTLTEIVERDLRNVLQYLASNESTLKSQINGITDYSVFKDVLTNGNYNDVLSNNKTAWRDYDSTVDVKLEFTAQRINDAGILEDFDYQLNKTYPFIGYYYQRWADAKSLEVLKLEEYWEAVRASYGKDWMKEVYGMVLVGAAENFGEQDLTQNVCDRLADYEKNDGNILMFHDTMARNKKGAVNLTNTLRDAFGLNRYHMTRNGSDYEVNKGYNTSKYFLTRMTIAGDMVVAKLQNFAWGGSLADYPRTLVGMSTNFAVYKNGIKSAPYKYGETNLFDELTNWSKDFKTYQENMSNGNFSSNRATQVNSGIITSYPFKISDKLNISLTHGQFLTLDVEDDEVITWYALSASAAKHQYTSMYAADPGDAADNYFIYSKGNVHYCGAGHAKVTGPLTDNNDERMLFINIICNSARSRALKPSIKIYDPVSKKVVPSSQNKYILQNSDGEPYIEVSSQEELIKFGFMATVDSRAEIESVKLYFKYTDGTGKETKEVVGTFPDAANNVDGLESGIDYYVNSTDTTNKKIADSIKLKPEYFGGYDDCAYIYIEVTDTNGEVLIEKIRIDLVRDLFELTDNSVEETPVGITLPDSIKDL